MRRYKPRDCEGCGQEFIPTGGRNRFCGEACRPPVYTRKYATKICGQCETEFVPSHGNAKYCSETCREAAHAYIPVPLNRCEHCGEKCGHRRWCDARCRHKTTYVSRAKPKVKRRKKFPVSRLPKQRKPRVLIASYCNECGEGFVVLPLEGGRPGDNSRRTLYCCPACGDRFRKRRSRVAHKAKRRAARKGVNAETVYRRKVFERDDWTCRLCGKPVDRDAIVPDPLAPTIDHILPLSLGGEHVYANVQCAHFICNSAKSANVTQLAFAA